MAIHIDSCAVWETIVVNTRFSVYELNVLRGDGVVMVRGGRHFTQFQRVLFLGSTADGSWFEPRTIDIGLRMYFKCGARVIITSPVQALVLEADIPAREPATPGDRDRMNRRHPRREHHPTAAREGHDDDLNPA